MARIVIIDSQISGISGDMLLSSLMDAGANSHSVTDAIFSCQNSLEGSSIKEATFEKKVLNSFKATHLILKYKDTVSNRKGIDMYRSLAACCDQLDMDQRGKTFALNSLRKIILAESVVHGEKFNQVHLHESSSIDTFVDLVGCAIALQDLKLLNCRIFSTKIAVGTGVFKFSHGIVANPGNAVLEIFRNTPFTIFGNQVEEELTTPTGAAMLVSLATQAVDYYPSFSVEKCGYGAGQKDLKKVPNILRLIIGKTSSSYTADTDTIFMIETNIDDVSGEIVGNLIEELSKSGAYDVSVIQGISKKNRPNYVIKVLSDSTKLNSVLEILFTESGTLGVRIQEVKRLIVPRSIVTISFKIYNRLFNVRIKTARDAKGNVVNFKPEFEDVKYISRTMGLSPKTVLDLVRAEVIQRSGGI
jgi:pyridinium-3,5-bisthiocarboxylic acid mononucleotide nickel chelatase